MAASTGCSKTETAYYDKHAENLLLTYPSRYLLIHGDQFAVRFPLHLTDSVGMES